MGATHEANFSPLSIHLTKQHKQTWVTERVPRALQILSKIAGEEEEEAGDPNGS